MFSQTTKALILKNSAAPIVNSVRGAAATASAPDSSAQSVTGLRVAKKEDFCNLQMESRQTRRQASHARI